MTENDQIYIQIDCRR